MVLPIATYNSDVTFMDTYLQLYRAKQRANVTGKDIDLLNFSDKSCYEKLHISFCKYILGTRKTASNLAVRTELGRYPLEMKIKVQSLLLYIRLLNSEINPLLYESFMLAKNLDASGCYTWYTYVKNIAQEVNIDLRSLEGSQNISQTKRIKRDIKVQVLNFYKNI